MILLPVNICLKVLSLRAVVFYDDRRAYVAHASSRELLPTR